MPSHVGSGQYYGIPQGLVGTGVQLHTFRKWMTAKLGAVSELIVRPLPLVEAVPEYRRKRCVAALSRI